MDCHPGRRRLGGRRRALVTAALAAAVAAPFVVTAGAAPRAQQAATSATATVAVSAVGTVTTRPDTATLWVRVYHQAPTVSAALARTAAVTRAIRGSLAADGVAAADIRTTGLDVSRVRTKRGVDRTASNELTITFRDVDRAREAVAGVGRAGGKGTRFFDFHYDVADPQRHLPAARAAAVADGRAAAAEAAAAQGGRLGAVRTVTEAPGWELSFRRVGEPRAGEPTASWGTAAVPPPPAEMTVSVRTDQVWDVVPASGGATAAKPARITYTAVGRASRPADYVRTHFSLRGWGTDKAAARANAAPAVRRLREALRAEGVAVRDVRADKVRMLDTYSRELKSSGWTAYCGFEVVVRDLARAEEIIASAARAVGSPTRLHGFEGGAAGQDALVRAGQRAARAGADAVAMQYAELLGRPLGKVVTSRPVPNAGVMRRDDATGITVRIAETRELR